MNRKVNTTKIQGQSEYAKVSDRLKLFREDCPRGLIETSYELKDDGTIVFTARVLKDKKNKDSGEATGHALGATKSKKEFEKIETVAIGRALATLGYLASGEVASAEEMEEFYEYQKTKIAEAVDKISECKTIEELKKVFLNMGSLIAEKEVVEAKDKRKKELLKVENENN